MLSDDDAWLKAILNFQFYVSNDVFILTFFYVYYVTLDSLLNRTAFASSTGVLLSLSTDPITSLTNDSNGNSP